MNSDRVVPAALSPSCQWVMILIGSDSDWCYSARLRHWEIWYIADAVVLHDTGVSGNPSEQAATIMLQDMYYWRDKWVGSAAYNYLSTRV